jgi:hypothetical protein
VSNLFATAAAGASAVLLQLKQSFIPPPLPRTPSFLVCRIPYLMCPTSLPLLLLVPPPLC